MRLLRPVVFLTFSRASPAQDGSLLASSSAQVARERSINFQDESLLASSPAQVAREGGIDTQPEWAPGAKVLVAGVGPEHLEPPFLEAAMLCRVMLYEDEVNDLLVKLEHEELPFEICKAKPMDALFI